jgi:hypothetical protein
MIESLSFSLSNNPFGKAPSPFLISCLDNTWYGESWTPNCYKEMCIWFGLLFPVIHFTAFGLATNLMVRAPLITHNTIVIIFFFHSISNL